MSHDNLKGDWHYPTHIRAGLGRIAELADCCRSLGMSAPLLVTDPGLALLPMVEDALARCHVAGLAVGLFSDIKGNPTGRNVREGIDTFRRGGHDGVIAFGGGSALDAGKAVALMAGQTLELWDLEDIGDNWTRADASHIAPIVAVPTTAGTGSEVGRAAVITDEDRRVKKIIFHPKLLPSTVILDPALTVGLPPDITAATGMDALSHNLEALCSPCWHPMAEGIAIEGMRLVREYLPRAVASGGDIEARSQMLVASTMGATAFQKGLGAMHALAHPLGALYDRHHGLLNAILMPYVLSANRAAIEAPIERAARYLALEPTGFDGFLNWVLVLRRDLGIPHSLGEIGIDDGQLQRIGRMATQDPSASGNPIAFSTGQYSDICSRAIRGDL